MERMGLIFGIVGFFVVILLLSKAIVSFLNLKKALKLKEFTKGLYLGIFEELPLACFVCNEDGLILDFNKEASSLFSKEVLTTRKNIIELLPSGFNYEEIIDCVFQGFGKTIEVFFEDLNIYGSITFSKVFLKGEARLIVFIQNLSPFKEMESFYKDRWSFMQLFVDSMPLPLFVIDANGKVLIWNKASEAITGIKKEEILSKSLDLSPLFGGRNLLIPAMLLTQMDPEIIEISTYRKIKVSKDYPEAVEAYGWIWVNGERKHVSIVASRIRDERGNLVGIIQCAKDITEQVNLQNYLYQMQKMEAIARFSAGISHELNNLLTVILGACDIISLEMTEKSGEKERISECIDYIKVAAEKGASISKQFQSLGRKMELHFPEVLDINEFISQKIESLRGIIEENISIQVSLDPEVGKVRIDPLHLEQILLNLLINARDAMPEGGKIHVKTSKVKLEEDLYVNYLMVPAGRYVLLSVSDTGEGIEHKNLKKIFEPYFTTKVNGTGLGLSIVYSILKQIGAYIIVRSEPGVGTTFEIYFPEISQSNFWNISGVDLRGRKILLIEDNSNLLAIMSEMLRNYGCHVIPASSGEEALALFKNWRKEIEAVITDIVLQDIDGKVIFDRIREESPSMPFIFMSGYSIDKILKYGIDLSQRNVFFLHKPFKIEGLLKVLSGIFQQVSVEPGEKV